MAAERRLITIGHSYVVAENRRLAHEMALAGRGRWHVTAIAPSSYHADLRRMELEPMDGEASELVCLGVRLAEKRLAASAVPVEIDGLDGQALPFADASADSALCTWSLCTIPDPVVAVQEVRRVLKPGGALHFVEHGLAVNEGVQRWQRRLDPVNRRLQGGCRLVRPIDALLVEAGLTVERLERSDLHVASGFDYDPDLPGPVDYRPVFSYFGYPPFWEDGYAAPYFLDRRG